VQDTFRATKTLTLVAGISWQPLYFPVDYFHRGTTFDMGAFLANKSSSVYTNAPAGSFYYGDPGVPGALTHNSPWNFNPNFGFTSDVLGNGKLVFRGGVALVFDQPNFFVSQRVQQSPPFATQTTPNTGAQLCFSHPWLIGGVGAGCSRVSGTDTSPFPQPQVPTPETAVFPAQSQYIVLQNRYQAPNTVQWTASIQQQFAHGWTAEIQYIGNRTQHLLLGLPLSPAVFVPGVWGPGGTGCAGIVTTGPAKVKPGAAGTNCSTTGNQNSRYALTIAYPLQGNQYLGGGGGSLLESNSGYANYNGMIATLQHRLSSTFSLLVNYTFSKCLNNSDPRVTSAAHNLRIRLIPVWTIAGVVRKRETSSTRVLLLRVLFQSTDLKAISSTTGSWPRSSIPPAAHQSTSPQDRMFLSQALATIGQTNCPGSTHINTQRYTKPRRWLPGPT
jgi:hypothetical protein